MDHLVVYQVLVVEGYICEVELWEDGGVERVWGVRGDTATD